VWDADEVDKSCGLGPAMMSWSAMWDRLSDGRCARAVAGHHKLAGFAATPAGALAVWAVLLHIVLVAWLLGA
jgi:hypothetical protein